MVSAFTVIVKLNLSETNRCRIPKNPANEGQALDNILLSSYQVRYRRSDGRDVEGVDVPFSISGPIRVTLPTRTTVDFSVTVVRHQAKVEPPLENITNLDIVTMGAEITLFGQTISGDLVSGSGSVQITFADFADGTSTCEQ